jgi:cell division septum initiation protein DivIVA
MPSFTTSLEFEVFCGTCGEGLCNQSETRESRNRRYPQVTVDACQKCIESETQPFKDEIYELKQKIEELEDQLNQIPST